MRPIPTWTLASGFALTSALLLLAVGCDFGEQGPPDPIPPVQTEIVRIEVIPSPVAAGDTALFRAVIEDSLDTRFRFFWSKDSGRFVRGDDRDFVAVTDTNSVRWVAPQSPGVYNQAVRADNGSRDSTAVGRSFDVTVVAPSGRIASSREPRSLD